MKPLGGKGTGEVNPAPGLDACLLYEDESDQDAKRSHQADGTRVAHFGSKFLSMVLALRKSKEGST